METQTLVWKTRMVRRPTPHWEERAAEAHVDSVPGPAMKSDSPTGCAGGLLTLLGLLLGPGRSMLDEGELRNAVESLTRDSDKRRALTLVVQDRLLTVVFSPGGVSGFDPRPCPTTASPRWSRRPVPA